MSAAFMSNNATQAATIFKDREAAERAIQVAKNFDSGSGYNVLPARGGGFKVAVVGRHDVFLYWL